jgi:hypothetical protein
MPGSLTPYRRAVKGSTSFNPPRGCGWTCLLVGAALAVLGIVSLLAIPKVLSRSREVWTETPGTVVESYLDEGTRKTKRKRSASYARTYQPRLKYRYRTSDRDFTGDAPALRQPADDEDSSEAKTIAESYRPGDALPVFHHPADAAKSRLTAKEPRREFWFDVAFGVIFLGSGAFLLLCARALLRRKPQEAQKDSGSSNSFV